MLVLPMRSKSSKNNETTTGPFMMSASIHVDYKKRSRDEESKFTLAGLMTGTKRTKVLDCDWWTRCI